MSDDDETKAIPRSAPGRAAGAMKALQDLAQVGRDLSMSLSGDFETIQSGAQVGAEVLDQIESGIVESIRQKVRLVREGMAAVSKEKETPA